MQVRMPTLSVTDEDRRAIRFAQGHRRTLCTRDEARQFLQDAVDQALSEVRFRWHGRQAAPEQDDEPVALGA